jgi:microcin C transport system substrate-binding protein
LWGHYVIPNWHLRNDRVLYWDKFSRPEVTPDSGTSTSLWWYDPGKAERLEQRQVIADIGDPGAADTPGAGAIVAWVAGLSLAGFLVFRRVLRPRRQQG